MSYIFVHGFGPDYGSFLDVFGMNGMSAKHIVTVACNVEGCIKNETEIKQV